MRRIKEKWVLAALFLAFIFSGNSIAGTATKWNVDKAHTSVNFKILHFFTPINGKFDDYNIDLNFDPENLAGSSIQVSIQIASVNTGFEPRDNHLRTADWFDAEAYPVMSFTSSEMISKGNGSYVARGKLKIKDVEKEIELPFKLLGVKEISDEIKPMVSGVDNIASFEASYTLNRKDYNVGAGTATPGKAAKLYRESVGDEVSIHIAVEANRMAS